MIAILRRPWFRLWAMATLIGIVLGTGLSRCEGPGPHPFTRVAQVTRTTLAPNACTRAYGQCWVTEYREHLRNGTVRIWTCFAQPPVKPGASNIWIAVNDCYRP